MQDLGDSQVSLRAAERTVGASTPVPFAASARRWLFGLYVLFVAGWSLWTGASYARAIDPWIVGDWLINYSGGFVRRGLTGAVAMLLHRATEAPLQWIVFAMEASVFVVFLAGVYRLTKGIRWSYLMVAVLVSPATLAFTVLAGHEAGLRKEILLFAALAVVLLVLIGGRWKDWQISALLSCLLVVLTLSHEALLVAVPYFFAAVAIQTMSLRRAARICAIPFVLCGIACGAVILYHGDRGTAEAICSSVGGTLGSSAVRAFHPIGGLCGGAIYWLQLDVAQGRELIGPAIQQWGLTRLFEELALPAFAPLVALMYLFYRRDGLRYEVTVLLGCALFSFAGTGVLFYVGIDWGRWLHLQAMCLMLLVMMMDRKAAAVLPVRRAGRGLRALAAVAVFVYATVWTLPGVGNEGERPGYVAIVWPLYRSGLHELRVTVVKGVRRAI
jgi:hypothetical protein